MRMKILSEVEFSERMKLGRNARLKVYDEVELTNTQRAVKRMEITLPYFLGTNYQETMIMNYINELKIHIHETYQGVLNEKTK
ncbi:hypothetical protein [Escherichia phage vB_EcoM_JNE01]|nr:hypothetical protein [Escherichia phage vB_EcoM_JNE01]